MERSPEPSININGRHAVCTATNMSYAKIKTKYKDSKRTINKFQLTLVKLTKLKSSLKFLLKCRKSNLIPNFIKNLTQHLTILTTDNKTHPDITRTLTRHTHFYHTKILNLLIKHKHNLLQEQTKHMEKAKTNIEQLMTTDDAKAFFESERNIENKITTTLKKRQETKHDKLRDQRNLALADNNTQREWFVNKTKIEFPPNVVALLAKGPKFALPISKRDFPLLKYIADGEELVQTIKEKETQESARTKFSLLVKEHKTKNNQNSRDRAILDTVEQTRKLLKENINIKILSSDKGNKTVAMDEDEYKNKMTNILDDLCAYRTLRLDPTSRLQTKNNTFVAQLFKMGLISKDERNKMTTTTAVPPRIYGLPKIHKEGTPLRPICSSIGSPSYGLCKYIIQILKNLTMDSRYNIKNAVDFKDRVNNSQIREEETLVSFDVVSLFPSIPIELALDTIRQKWTKLEEHTNIPKQLFMDIVRFCIQENRYFKYEDKIYTQLKGMPMGSPASPVIADILMEELLDKITDKLKIKPRLLTKYVDDLFAITNKIDVENILKELNSFHKQIKFTMELEKDGKLPFLDSIVSRMDNTLKIKWYRKPIASGRILNFNSNHPKSMIINTALGCMNRMMKISDTIYHKEIEHEIKELLTKNDFPPNIIKTLLKRRQIERKKPTEPAKIYKSLIYVPRLSERLTNSDCYNKQDIKVAHKPTNTLQKFFNKIKSKIPMIEKSNVVYQIPCGGDNNNKCNSVYIGTTKSKLKTRISQHKSDFKLRHQNNIQKTARMTHCIRSNHTPNFDETTILQQEQHYNKRHTLEMLHIINTPTYKRLNYKTDTENCAHLYRHLLNSQTTSVTISTSKSADV
ncbi:uncharacterized protein [Drosophila virilis]|uniref:uncharacterized protein n=1 Tax=Drosophila virilis TaxID=7244 RepID=UPI0038B29DCC